MSWRHYLNMSLNDTTQKFKIQKMLGKTPAKRKTSLENEYEKVQIVRGRAYWGGINIIIQKQTLFIRN